MYFLIRHTVCFLALCGVFLLSPTQAQHYKFSKLDLTEGLPSKLVLKSIEDKEGYRWFLTDKGISRFDGQFWKAFGRKDGYTDLGAFFIKEDVHGSIWIISTNFHLYRFANNHFERVQINSDLAWLDIDHFGQVVVVSRDLQFFKVNQDLTFKQVLNLKLPRPKEVYLTGPAAYTFCFVNDSSLLVTSSLGVFFVHQKLRNVKLVSQNFTYVNKIVPRVFRSSDNRYFFSVKDKLLEFLPEQKNSREIASFEGNEIYDLNLDTVTKQMLVGSFKGLFVRNPELQHLPFQKLFDKSVTSINKASTNQIILATINDGVYKTELQAKHFSRSSFFNNTSIEYLRIFNKDVLAITVDGNIYVIKRFEDKFSCERFDYDVRSNGKVSAVVTSSTGDSLIISATQTHVLSKKGFFTLRYDEKHTGQSWLIGLNDDSVSFIFDKTILSKQYPDLTHELTKYITNTNVWLYPHRAIRNIGKRMFGQTRVGLVEFVVDHQTVKKHIIYENLMNVSDVHQISQQRFLVATQDQGLYIVKDGIVLDHIDVSSGLASNMCKRIVVHKGKYWICTNKGISVMTLSGKINFVNYDESNFLIDNEVTDIAFCKGFVYVSTSEGVSVFSENVMPIKQSPRVFVTQLQVNNLDTPLQAFYEFPYTHNNINVFYIHPNPLGTKRVQYKYVLYGSQNDTGYTEQTELRLSSLQSGEYALKIWARNAYGEWSDTPAEVTFTIAVPYWRTYWFIGLLIIGIGGMIGYGYWLYFRNKKKELAYQERLSESERKALRLQMNPHFIFNTLNSLQSFILQHKPLEANKYISKLATLMRWVMIHAEKQTVSLATEIRFLEIYIELEQFRMEQAFTCDWYIDEQVTPDRTFVPALMIQPIIENAIKYGLSDTNKPGILKIRMHQRQDVLEVSIEDNGKGRAAIKKEQELSGKEYASTGITSINERLKLLLGIDYAGNPVTIVDLEDQDGNATGTKVVLVIPYESE